MRRCQLLSWMIIGLVLSLTGIATAKTWTVSGTITTTPCKMTDLKKGLGDKVPLRDVEVRVQGKLKNLTWGTWSTTRTNSHGKFSVSKKKNNWKRSFRVQVKFSSKNLLVVKGAVGLIAGWHTVYSTGLRSSGFNKTINMTSSSQGGCTSDRMRHSEIWVAAEAMRLKLAALKRPFIKKIRIRYPVDNKLVNDTVEAPFANPLDGWISIIKNKQSDWLNTGTVWHEMTHIWAYQHSRGETKIVGQLLKDSSTHDHQEKSFVAFHEGFASFVEDQMKYEILGGDKGFVWSRTGLAGVRLTTPTKVERNDYGWRSILLMLTHENIVGYDFNAATAGISELNPMPAVKCPGRRRLSLRQILGTFYANPGKGYKQYLHTDEMTFKGFYKRASRVNSTLRRSDRKNFRELITHNSTKQPHELFCEPIRNTVGVPNSAVNAKKRSVAPRRLKVSPKSLKRPVNRR